MIKDILVPLVTYPDPTSPAALETAVAIAASMKAAITGFAAEVELHVRPHMMADMVLDVQGMAQEAEARSHQAGTTLLERLGALAAAAGVEHSRLSVRRVLPLITDVLVRQARLHDLTIFSLAQGNGQARWYGEEIIFGSGRPVLILPDSDPARSALQRVTVAWDGSRAAARALADAMPFLHAAQAVHVVCVADEKDVAGQNPRDILGHLQRHGLNVVYEEVKSGGSSIHDAIRTYVTDVASDLLVMGAFGHSRLRQFVLGGATRSLLEETYVPTLLSH